MHVTVSVCKCKELTIISIEHLHNLNTYRGANDQICIILELQGTILITVFTCFKFESHQEALKRLVILIL